VVEQVAGDLRGEGTVAMINVDDNRPAGAKYGIRGIPTLVVLKDGKIVGQIRSRDRGQIAAEFRNFL
jgi:thioredoxin 1